MVENRRRKIINFASKWSILEKETDKFSFFVCGMYSFYKNWIDKERKRKEGIVSSIKSYIFVYTFYIRKLSWFGSSFIITILRCNIHIHIHIHVYMHISVQILTLYDNHENLVLLFIITTRDLLFPIVFMTHIDEMLPLNWNNIVVLMWVPLCLYLFIWLYFHCLIYCDNNELFEIDFNNAFCGFDFAQRPK